MFDSTNAADLIALRDEVSLDPVTMGYASANGETAVILDLLNDPDNNVLADVVNRPTEELNIPEIAGVINEAEYSATSAYDKAWVEMFINRPEEVTLKPYQSKFLEVFPIGSDTTTSVLALREKLASRAESLFGVNTIISEQDWFAARDYI